MKGCTGFSTSLREYSFGSAHTVGIFMQMVSKLVQVPKVDAIPTPSDRSSAIVPSVSCALLSSSCVLSNNSRSEDVH